MSARILVVDDVPANVKLLEARLSAEYFDVVTASCGAEALEICGRGECDIVLRRSGGQPANRRFIVPRTGAPERGKCGAARRRRPPGG